MEALWEPPIKPVYWQEKPNAPISFGSFRGSLTDKTECVSKPVAGEARLQFTPKARLRLVVRTCVDGSSDDAFLCMHDANRNDFNQIHFDDFNTTHEVFCTSNSGLEVELTPGSEPIQVFKPTESITRAVFHLFNWPDILGPQSYWLQSGGEPNQGGKSCARISLLCNGWSICIAATDKSDTAIKAVGELGGFSITHVGQLERADKSPFSSDDLMSFLRFLEYFFTFVLGRWSSPCMTVGFAASGELVYEEWGMRRCDVGAWSGGISWFDRWWSGMFAGVLPGFMGLWANKDWHRPLRMAVSMYISANQGGSGLGLDLALLIIQAALELLSSTYGEFDQSNAPKALTNARSQRASDNLRNFISRQGIPLEIPPTFESLRNIPGKRWDDSMHVLTDLRNGLVHRGGDDAIPSRVYYEAWRLSMWYLELVILRLCEYSGKYSNRLVNRELGQVDTVPWGGCTDSTRGGA